MGVLEKVDSSDWGTPLVPVLKPNGDLSICADYKVTVNKHLIDVKYPLPRIEEVFASLEGGELFTKLDMSNAYNQLVLNEKSQNLCTWSTHIGLLKVKRLPFGIKTAAAIFQRTVEMLLRGIPYVVVYQDDITVTGRSTEEHIKILRIVLSKLAQAGLTLNVSKCQFFQHKINYLGFEIGKNGLRITPERVECILKAPPPSNVKEVKAFAGMANYYSKFINNFVQKITPLYNLLRKDVKFKWTKECQGAYETIKSDIASDNILAHFNPKIPIILTTDASNSAIAGILSHKFSDNIIKPIAFVSRALTKSEQNYASIEKEALAIVFCATRLRQYLLGNRFTIRTDHKPLLSLFGQTKGLPIMAAARIQRWAVIMSGFEYEIEYLPGKNNSADGLSRMPQTFLIKEFEEHSYIHFIESNNHLNINFKDIAKETRKDPILSRVMEAIIRGEIQKLSGSEYEAFRAKQNELTVEYGCIMWGYRTVIPTKFRGQILSDLHASHLGIVKTKSLARSYLWWPGIDREIEVLISNCVSCQELQSSPEKSHLIPWKPTDSVWSRIHIDFAGPITGYFLFVIVDSHSKWVEVFTTKQITSNFVIHKMRELFARYGLVNTIVSDNGRQFTSDQFKNFLRINGINHILTAPGHPATNGQAENFIKTLMKSILSTLRNNDSLYIDTVICRFLIDYRNSCHGTTGESPSRIFLGRMLRTRFSLLKPPLVREKIIQNQARSIENHRGNRDITFQKGEKVWIRDYRDPNKPKWSPATISKQLGPRSYHCILAQTGRQIKRHLNQIRNATPHIDGSDETKTQGQIFEESQSAVLNYQNEKNSQRITGGETSHSACHNDTPKRQLRPRLDGRVVRP